MCVFFWVSFLRLWNLGKERESSFPRRSVCSCEWVWNRRVAKGYPEIWGQAGKSPPLSHRPHHHKHAKFSLVSLLYIHVVLEACQEMWELYNLCSNVTGTLFIILAVHPPTHHCGGQRCWLGPLLNFETKSKFWDFRSLRHLIRMMT